MSETVDIQSIQVTPAEENYLKGLWHLQQSHAGMIHTNSVAEALQTKPSSATDMLQRLGKKGLVEYRAYKGAALTETGHLLAVDVVRRHRLWETFLHRSLRFRWDEVHALAEQLEHIRHTEMIDRLEAFLEKPAYDPHGEPIPNAEGHVKDVRNPVALSSLQPGNIGRLVAVKEHGREFLKYLETSNLILGSKLEVLKIQAYDGSMQVQLAVKEVTLSEKVAENLLIEVLH